MPLIEFADFARQRARENISRFNKVARATAHERASESCASWLALPRGFSSQANGSRARSLSLIVAVVVAAAAASAVSVRDVNWRKKEGIECVQGSDIHVAERALLSIAVVEKGTAVRSKSVYVCVSV